MEKPAAEIFGGIEFVRISSLPKNQQELFWQSTTAEKIIKILRKGELLWDCLLYKDYLEWHSFNSGTQIPENKIYHK